MESEREVVFTIVIGGDTWEFRYPFGVPFPDVGEVIHLEEEEDKDPSSYRVTNREMLFMGDGVGVWLDAEPLDATE